MESRKQDIIKAAARMFSEKGYQNTSVDEIARESGIAKASFYRLFSSKEAVLAESLMLYLHELESRLRNLIGLSGLTPKQKLYRIILEYLDCTLENKVHVLLLMQLDTNIFKDQGVFQSHSDIDNSLNYLIKDSIIDIYGDDAVPFIWDLAFLVRGISIEYILTFSPYLQNKIKVSEMASFLTNIVDISIKGMMDKESGYEPLWGLFPWYYDPDQEHPMQIRNQTRTVLKNLSTAVEQLQSDEQAKLEYREVLQTLMKVAGEKEVSESGIAKACIAYLEQRPELREYCVDLRKLWKLEGLMS